MRTMGWGSLLVWTLAVATVLLARSPATDSGSLAFASGNTAEAVRIDTDPSGNTATSVASVETCREVSTGQTFDVDVVIDSVTNLLAFDSSLYYDKQILRVVDGDTELFLSSAPDSQVRDQSDPTPDSDGYYGFRGLDTSKDPAAAESGSGVLGRVTLEAIGPGISTISVNTPSISPAFHDVEYDYLEPFGKYGTWLGDVFDSRIAVDEPCPSETVPIPPPPGVTPVVRPGQQPPAGQTPAADTTADSTPVATVSPGANTADAIRIDTDPSGNTATSLGNVDACREVALGEQFDVDIVIENVTSLLAFSATLTYDEGMFQVVDEDVSLFLASAPTSDLSDTSDSLPDSDGVYEVRALDLSADPAAAESGSGVLARLTLEATSQGLSTLSTIVPSISPVLTDAEGNALEPADAFGAWLGEVSDAQIAVDEACPEVISTPTPSVTPSPEDEGDGDDLTVVWVVVAVIGGAAALLVIFATWRRMRGRVS